MTNLVLLSIQLVTNDVSHSEFRYAGPIHRYTNVVGQVVETGNLGTNFWIPKKEVWQLYTIGYQEQITHARGSNDPMVFYQFNGPKFPMLTLSNMIGTLEPKQETNWVFTPTIK